MADEGVTGEVGPANMARVEVPPQIYPASLCVWLVRLAWLIDGQALCHFGWPVIPGAHSFAKCLMSGSARCQAGDCTGVRMLTWHGQGVASEGPGSASRDGKPIMCGAGAHRKTWGECAV